MLFKTALKKQQASGFTLMNKASERSERAFTLIELLVVISIIGILATLMVANLNAGRSRSRDAVRKADLKNIQTALRMYYNDKGKYPTSITFGSGLSSSGVIYMNKIPNDPISTKSYTYTNDSVNDTFTLRACLENISDQVCDKDEQDKVIACPSNASECRYSLTP